MSRPCSTENLAWKTPVEYQTCPHLPHGIDRLTVLIQQLPQRPALEGIHPGHGRHRDGHGHGPDAKEFQVLRMSCGSHVFLAGRRGIAQAKIRSNPLMIFKTPLCGGFTL